MRFTASPRFGPPFGGARLVQDDDGVAIMAGLLPVMWSAGTGSEIMQRIKVPMIGGMITSTVLTLTVIAAIFGLVKGLGLPSESIWTAAGAKAEHYARCAYSGARLRQPLSAAGHFPRSSDRAAEALTVSDESSKRPIPERRCWNTPRSSTSRVSFRRTRRLLTAQTGTKHGGR